MLWCSLALSDAVPAIVDAIVSTSKLDNPPVSGGQEESISTQPSAATDASDVQDVVAAIVDRVAASAENRVPLSDVDPFSSTQQPQQAEPSNSAFQETEGLPGALQSLAWFSISADLLLSLQLLF